MPDRPGKILFASDNEQLARPVVHLLRSSGHDVSEVLDAAEAGSWLRVHRADLAVMDLSKNLREDTARSLNVFNASARRTGTQLLVLARAGEQERLRLLFTEGRISNLLAVDADGQIEPVELTVTVSKILTKDILGIERYLAAGSEIATHEVRRSVEKDALVDVAQEFALKSGAHARVAESYATACDELVTNAFYDAPVGQDGKHRFASLPRTVPVELDANESIRVQFAYDGRQLCVATRDPFGSLEPGKIEHYLAKCFAQGSDQVDEKQGGAGLGLYYVFNLVNHFVFNIQPHVCTETIGLLDASRSYRKFATRAKSFNVFVAERS
jgi:CheY-like chemotaxis protein